MRRLNANARILDSHTVLDYLKNVRMMNEGTAETYHIRLRDFERFAFSHYKFSIDDLVTILKVNDGYKDQNPYSVLNNYIAYLQQNSNVSTVSIKQRIITAKNFFEYYDIDISPRKFKLKVKLPKIIRRNKDALAKSDIMNILNACSEIRLKTYVMLLAGTGMRATEALSTRICDCELDAEPATIFVRGDYTKTKTDRIVYITKEMANQLKTWLEYKYRPRRICYYDKKHFKVLSEYRVPKKSDGDLLFSSTRKLLNAEIKMPLLRSIYHATAHSFAKTLDRMGKGEREGNKLQNRRKITLHSFRRFVKSTISDLGYSDYSEWFIGHSGSTYYRRVDKERAEIFLKIEPYLTFLNIHELERHGADIQTKVEELEGLNQSLRNRDKLKDDAIAHLSDQLVTITTRLQELERKQQ